MCSKQLEEKMLLRVLTGQIYRYKSSRGKNRWTKWVSKETVLKAMRKNVDCVYIEVYIRGQGWVGVNTSHSIDGGYWDWDQR